MCVCVCACVCIGVCVGVCERVCVCRCVWVCVRACVGVRASGRARARARVFVCVGGCKLHMLPCYSFQPTIQTALWMQAQRSSFMFFSGNRLLGILRYDSCILRMVVL